jgi:hypothetical protein
MIIKNIMMMMMGFLGAPLCSHFHVIIGGHVLVKCKNSLFSEE